ncbi:ATP-binding protein [Armatimonas sp.]|uniref:ATP-binding protein n=1 Tax=Armatimonas sp. TaxID=1872638 RepID=UPI00374D9789
MDALNLKPTREAETEEYKRSWQEKECLDALAALANTRGGVLWVGVQDNGSVAGWYGDGKEMERISNTIVAKLQVHPRSMTIETLEGTPVLAIQMAQAVSPVALNGRFFRRVGNSTREVPTEELPRFLLEKTGQSWDELPSDATIGDLFPEAISIFRTRAKLRLPEASQAETDNLLIEKLGLIHSSGRLKRGGVLLFTESPQHWYPTARVQAARFENDGITISDDQRFDGPLLQQLEGVLEWLRQRLRVTYEFPSEGEGIASLQRREVWEIPLVALREAFLNALLHRDYTAMSAIQVRLYPDRVVIMNVGGLSEHLTVADLTRPHNSLPRNPLLASIAHKMELIESWGTGTLRMAEALNEVGLPAPEFVSTSGSFTVTLWHNRFSDAMLRQMGLTERQVRGVRLTQQRGAITNREYREAFRLSDEATRRELNFLVENGILRREGSGRGVRYLPS